MSCNKSDLYDSLPREVNGWLASEEDLVFDRNTLFDHIDGGAELFLTYTYQNAFVRRYTKLNQPDIILDVYDMSTSGEAFGIFSVERDGEEFGIGQGSEYGGGALRFWKDKYFVSIIGIGRESKTKDMVVELGRQVSDAIPGSGELPSLASVLPTKGLNENKIRYFHAAHCMNAVYFLANENILNLDETTDCVFTPYLREGETSNLLLVSYASADASEKAYENFIQTYMPEARRSGCAKMEDGTWTVAAVRGYLLMIVFESPDKDSADRLLSEVTVNE